MSSRGKKGPICHRCYSVATWGNTQDKPIRCYKHMHKTMINHTTGRKSAKYCEEEGCYRTATHGRALGSLTSNSVI